MSRTHAVAGSTMLSALTFFAAISAQGAATQPDPPAQICVNGQCTTAPVPPPPPPPPPTGGTHIKWHPGHYMASYTVLYGGGSPAFMQSEMADLNNQDNIVGYRMLVSWSALEPTQGNYDFSAIDAALARLKTAYNKPKQLVIMLWTYSHHSYYPGDISVVPAYIQQNPAYGASPIAGSYGWWGMNANGASTGMYAPALYNPAVMDRFIALLQAMGNHLDSDPNVEGIYFQENSTIVQAANSSSNKDPNYSDSGFVTQYENLLSATTAAFPHTSVILANTWLVRSQNAVALELWMAANRIAASSADTYGQSTFNAHGDSILAPGLAAYIGIAGSIGGTGDMRPVQTAMMDVESGDMSTTYFNKFGGPWTPLDIINGLNQTYQASHAFWTRMLGANVPVAARWPQVAAVISANPLTRTAYPKGYP